MSELSNINIEVSDRIRDPQCSLDDLANWAGMNTENDRLIASHCNVGAETLKKLSRSEDKKTRENVTSNPNTPVNVLIYLADDFPRAFLLNPAFDLIFLEEPVALERLYETTLAKILSQRECPLPIIDWAYRTYKRKNSYSSSAVLKGVVKNPNTPDKIIKAILKMRSDTDITCQETFL